MNIMNSLGFSRMGTAKNESKFNLDQMFHEDGLRQENEKRIYNLVILDESGSMESIRQQSLDGVNDLISSIRKAQEQHPDDNQRFCLVTFDSGSGSDRPNVRPIVNSARIEEVEDLTLSQYHPDGCTPLYDAIGYSVTSLKRLVKEGDNVLVTVITDGYENDSKHYNNRSVKELVESLSGKGWVFTYIGANQDSEKEASFIGISDTMDFEASRRGTGIMFDRMSSSYTQYYKKVRLARISGDDIDESDFFSNKSAVTRVTPENIEELEDNQIFVFGSNAIGDHSLGYASSLAMNKFGAQMGKVEGIQGRSYAIPVGGVTSAVVREAVERFVFFAETHPELTFLVTRIGCGKAGYTEREMAPLFASAFNLPNVYMPASFWKELTYNYQ